MRKLKSTKVWIPAFLMAGLLSGCGDADTRAGKPGDPLTPPAVTSPNPLNGSVFTCNNPVVINATFTKAMNPATINTTTFTLAAGNVSVAGVVTYVATTNVATLTPSAPLSPNTLYVATITTGAQDQFGNGLTANFFWSFTTSPPVPSAHCDRTNSSERLCQHLPQHRHHHRDFQYGDEPGDHQHDDIYSDRDRRGQHSGRGDLRGGDQCCHLYTHGGSFT